MEKQNNLLTIDAGDVFKKRLPIALSLSICLISHSVALAGQSIKRTSPSGIKRNDCITVLMDGKALLFCANRDGFIVNDVLFNACEKLGRKRRGHCSVDSDAGGELTIINSDSDLLNQTINRSE